LIQSQGYSTYEGIGAANQFAITDLGHHCLLVLQFGTDNGESGVL
jgi:hypothetical protein